VKYFIGRKKLAKQPILFIGMSHLEALKAAYEKFGFESHTIEMLQLNRRTDIYNRETNELNIKKISGYNPRAVFISIGGNFHNVFGLIENPVPFRIGGRVGSYPADKKRFFIPRSMMRAHFEARLSQRFFPHIQAIKNLYSDAPCAHISSPPPIADPDYLVQHPGVFRPKIDMGITPKELRIELYRLHTECYQRYCNSIGVDFIYPPAIAVDRDGAMKKEYFNNDPTHGNINYGRLCLNQIAMYLENHK